MAQQAEERCIYCDSPIKAKSQGDHLIPAALGEFKNALKFRRICEACNNRLSPSEEQLLRCAPSAFIRKFVVPTTKRSRGRQRETSPGAAGAPPPQAWAHFPTHKQAVRLTNSPNLVEPYDQLVVYDETDKPHVVPLNPEMSPESLRQAVNRLGLRKVARTTGHFAKEHEDVYRHLISQAWPESSMAMGPDLPTGRHEVPVEVEFKVTEHFFRAIAKIAFHYYLTHSQRSRGDEEYFQRIRAFIMSGGGQSVMESVFLHNRVFAFLVPAGACPASWCHVLGAAEDAGSALAMVRLFWGPDSEGETYTLNLGCIPTAIILPKSRWGHVYAYRSPDRRGKYAGEVRGVPLTRL